jgi:sporulation protein YlmC with PRC-barrel domain
MTGTLESMMSLHSQTGRQWIESDRMIDRLVFDDDGKSIGTIRRLLIDRRSGHVDQVVVHTHGHFTFGALDLELPWASLGYDTRLPGYRFARGAMDFPVAEE